VENPGRFETAVHDSPRMRRPPTRRPVTPLVRPGDQSPRFAARAGSLAGCRLLAPETGPSARAGFGLKCLSPFPDRSSCADGASVLAADAEEGGGALRAPSRAPRGTPDEERRRSLLDVEPAEWRADCAADEPPRGSCGRGGPTPLSRHPLPWQSAAGDHRIRCPPPRSLRAGDSLLYPPPSGLVGSRLPLDSVVESHPKRPAPAAYWSRFWPPCGGEPSPPLPGSRLLWKRPRSIADPPRGTARGPAGRSGGASPLPLSWAPLPEPRLPSVGTLLGARRTPSRRQRRRPRGPTRAGEAGASRETGAWQQPMSRAAESLA
jgi:hypothetical protein